MNKDIKFTVSGYNKQEYENLINVKFSSDTPKLGSIIQEQENLFTVDDFFNQYNNLFYDIPEYGELNSHEYLIKTSTEYIDFDKKSDEIVLLQNEISDLRVQLLEEQKKVIELQTGQSIEIPTINPGSNTAGGTNVINSY